MAPPMRDDDEPDPADFAEPDCFCGQDDCPECNRWCHYCGGDGWGIEGHDWPVDDPVNDAPGAVQKCPCCGGTGRAEDCTFW